MLSSCVLLGFDEQEGTVENDYINSCSRTTDGNVVLVGHTNGDWEEAANGDFSMVAVKLDATDGTVIWRYQVRTKQGGGVLSGYVVVLFGIVLLWFTLSLLVWLLADIISGTMC